MHRWHPALAASLLALLTGAAAQAEVYRWVDEDGTVHYSGQPHQSGDQQAERVEMSDVNTADGVEVSAAGPDTSSTAGGGGEVVMYSASWCGYCDKARAYFERNDIPLGPVNTSPDHRDGGHFCARQGAVSERSSAT